MKRPRFCLCSALAMLALAGCEGRRVREHKSPVAAPPRNYVVGVILDLSGSFEDFLLGGDQRAWRFFGQLVNRYGMDTGGDDVRIVIAGLSGAEASRSLLWEGSMAQLRRFSAQSFRDMLLAKAQPGSRVFDSIAELVNYVRLYPGVADGRTKSAVFALTDGDDNVDTERGRRRMLDELREYRRAKGVLGLYFIDRSVAAGLDRDIRALGYDHNNFVLESGIVQSPTIPSFEN